MKYFLKKLLGHEVFRSMVPWASKFLKCNANNAVPFKCNLEIHKTFSTFLIRFCSRPSQKLHVQTLEGVK